MLHKMPKNNCMPQTTKRKRKCKRNISIAHFHANGVNYLMNDRNKKRHAAFLIESFVSLF